MMLYHGNSFHLTQALLLIQLDTDTPRSNVWVHEEKQTSEIG